MTVLEMPTSLVETHQPAEPPAPVAHSAPPDAQPCIAANGRLWVLVAFQAIMAGVLVTGYVIFREVWPDAFASGRTFLDPGWGILGTVALLLSSITMALAVRSAHVGEQFNSMLFLTLTIMCGICFAGVRVIEYAHHHFASAQLPDPSRPRTSLPAPPAAATPAAPARSGPDLAAGERFYNMVCAACHGRAGEGMKGLGLPLNDSELVSKSTPADLSAFIKTGRAANDPGSKMNAAMLPRGGASFLTDLNVDDIVAYMRKSIVHKTGATVTGSAPAIPASTAAEEVPTSFVIPPSKSPKGMRPEFLHDVNAYLESPSPDEAALVSAPPKHARLFFRFHAVLTGLHGLHLLLGLGILAWLLKGVALQQPVTARHAVLQTGGLYWQVAGITGIALFPLLYLMR